ncbi:DNA-binding transcriptional ArsR family regulator [Kitasatospora sp. MAA19]|uniref:helix-turn-helix domain-containing protein n=1 Tax=Kitasatospora sp. MAA19 TaxID=3035090 RepID=UPI002476CE0F|nr:helix-turn-helix domain-containing protein [Kitasatospora sp. MAA19]MDH6704660.1 DNA-binding transcriptional ArsR family regulator [Kitasatospora sp. MAA19]
MAEHDPRPADGGEQPATWVKERQVADVAVLKALADPLRLAILGALKSAEDRPQTAKEIAAALGEPQTKLYRHIKQLEKAGLIMVAGTRLVSGIVESRYTAAQESIRLAPEMFTADSPARSEAYDAILAAIDRVRGDFRAQVLGGRLDFSSPRDGSAGPPGLFAHSVLRLSPDRLLRLRTQLADLLDELNEEAPSTAEDAMDVTLFTLLYGLRTGTES